MINTQGYFNEEHRIWKLDFIKKCHKCTENNNQDANLELYLRFKMIYLLKIENDNFTQKFREYEGIEFIFNIPKICRNEQFNKYENIINTIIEQKRILGIGFRIPNNFSKNLNTFTSYNFTIPVLAYGKMWQIIFDTLNKNNNNNNKNIIINEKIWNEYKYKGINHNCLICNNFPFGIYPGNFIVNQNILYMRGFIWMDKKKFHMQKHSKKFVAYNDNSVIISWPFLKFHINTNSINHLGNMVCFTSGDIFPNYIDTVMKKINKISFQNTLIQKIKRPLHITVEDLKLMYRYCRRKKRFCIKTFDLIHDNENNNNKETEIENAIISIIKASTINEKQHLPKLLPWFKFPKSKTNLGVAILEISQMIKRGEIDSAITQTSILNKDYSNINNSNFNNKTNLDVHRIGRYTRNVATNDFWNICAIGSGIQKVLPKDSKTKEPKKITKSEIGFLDLINTPDTPRHCGLILESVVDVLISTYSMTCSSIKEAFLDLYPDNFEKVDEAADNIWELNSQYIYVCADFELYRFKPQSIPSASYMKQNHYQYMVKSFGIQCYFRMTQYALKIKYPCIELVKESEQFWVCTSRPRIFYKIHVDGLLYTAKEMEYFEKNIADNLWIGKQRQNICNIFGPSTRGTPRPNTSHLPRISHSVSSSWKHAIGIPTNTNQHKGSIYQKNLTVSYYCLKLHTDDNIIMPGFTVFVLVMSGFNNQEDGIAVRKSVIEKGMFLATSYETASVRISYSIFQSAVCKIKFIPTIKKNQILRKGLQIGYFRNKTVEEIELEEEEHEEEEEEEEEENNNTKIINKDRLIDIFSPELKLVRYDLSTRGIYSNHENNDEKNECLAVIWNGKDDDDDDDDDQVKGMSKKTMYKCHELKCHDIKCMKQLKMYLIYSCQFTPTVGDKLQTSTSQKGVITQLISDEDMPFVNLPGNETLIPEFIVNPQYLKRQTFDNIFNTGEMLSSSSSSSSNKSKNPYLESCFSYQIEDSIYHIKLGSEIFTGKVINPITGYPYMRPVSDNSKSSSYRKPFHEYLGEDNFTYITRNDPKNDFYEIVEGSIYVGQYFNVHNHRAENMMQSSKCDKKIIRTDFSGAPIRGKKGGFSTGPQEQLTLSGLGMTRLCREVSLFRSDYCNVILKPKNKEEEEEEEVFAASTTFRRMHDDLDMRDLNVTYKVRKLYK